MTIGVSIVNVCTRYVYKCMQYISQTLRNYEDILQMRMRICIDILLTNFSMIKLPPQPDFFKGEPLK